MGVKNRGLLTLFLPDVSPASVTGIFKGLGSWAVARTPTQEQSPLKMPAIDVGETSGRKSISRPRSLSPKGKHSNISVDRESLNQNI